MQPRLLAILTASLMVWIIQIWLTVTKLSYHQQCLLRGIKQVLTFPIIAKLAVELRQSVSADGVPGLSFGLQRLLDEPLDHGEDLYVVEALDLMRFEAMRAFHPGQGADDLLGESDLGANGGVLLEEEVDVHVDAASGDAPSHPAHDLVEIRKAFDSRAKIT